MKIETQIINGYWGLLSSLAPKLKLKLIEKLSKSIEKDISKKRDKFEESFGAWTDSRESDEIINKIRENRSVNRYIEPF